MEVGPGTKTGIKIASDNPKEMGADRIVDVVAAFEKFGGPTLVIDFGTAKIINNYPYSNVNNDVLNYLSDSYINNSKNFLNERFFEQAFNCNYFCRKEKLSIDGSSPSIGEGLPLILIYLSLQILEKSTIRHPRLRSFWLDR